MKILCIDWLDASVNTGTVEPKEVKTSGLMRMRAVGFLIGEDEVCIRLTMESQLTEGPGSNEPDFYRRVMVIPKVGIRRVQEFKCLEWGQ